MRMQNSHKFLKFKSLQMTNLL